MDKGWFKVPGIRPHGDRSLDEQRMGLEKALAECKGKRVLDLGCAEALISREFALAGAKEVVGMELLAPHLDVARKVCKGLPVRFIQAHLGDWATRHPVPGDRFEIVLALGIIHKLDDPGLLMRWAAYSAKELLCFRAPAKKTEAPSGDYLIKSKFTNTTCNVPETMRAAGFVDEGTHNGVRGEAVQYWRRTRQP